MSLLRYLLVLVLGAGALALALVVAVPESPAVTGARVLSRIGPERVAARESYAIYGGLELPAGRLEKRLRVCGDEGCRFAGWGGVEGPGEWWGSWGTLRLEPGRYQVELLLLEPRLDGARTIARHGWEVEAY